MSFYVVKIFYRYFLVISFSEGMGFITAPLDIVTHLSLTPAW